MEKFKLLRTPIKQIVVDSSACDVNDLAPCAGIQVTVPASENWGDLVRRGADSEWVGIEALAGQAGRVADVVRINAEAYGQRVADTVMSVRTWDVEKDQQRTFAAADCGFTEGGSKFQEQLANSSLRYEILDVSFLFKQGTLSRVTDDSLAATLGVAVGERVALQRVVDAAAA